jgi:hypothetical protein
MVVLLDEVRLKNQIVSASGGKLAMHIRSLPIVAASAQ